MANHTETPWHIAGTSNPSTNPRESLWGPIPLGAQSGEWIAKDIRPANAAFIVRAVNCHEELIRLLQTSADKFRLLAMEYASSSFTDRHDDGPRFATLAKAIEDAVAKAKAP